MNRWKHVQKTKDEKIGTKKNKPKKLEQKFDVANFDANRKLECLESGKLRKYGRAAKNASKMCLLRSVRAEKTHQKYFREGPCGQK